MNRCTIHTGDALTVLRTMESQSVHCCVTSPPYWGLRDYGVSGQLGLELTPESYIQRMVEVFQEVRRVLRNDGTLWVNMGDSYASAYACSRRSVIGQSAPTKAQRQKRIARGSGRYGGGNNSAPGLKEKDLCGVPWMLAFGLRADGWYLRQDVIWSKPNPMPESVTDRCTKSHEYIFLLSKSAKYYYDQNAIKEPVSGSAHSRSDGVNPKARGYKMPDGWDTGPGAHGSFHRNGHEKGKTPGKNSRINITRTPNGAAPQSRQNESFSAAVCGLVENRNKRSVWTVGTHAFPEAHFATFPPKLIEPCILAGCPQGGVVLDPFNGAGTTGLVALANGRNYIGIELNPEYVKLTEKRLEPIVGGLFAGMNCEATP